MKISEILKPMTIVGATDSHGHVNRAKAERIPDPRGWFAKNKRALRKNRKPTGSVR